MTDTAKPIRAKMSGQTAAAMFLLAAARTEKGRGNHRKARDMFLRALPGFSLEEEDSPIRGLIYMELAETMEALDRADEAAQYSEKAFQVMRELASN